MFLLHTPSRDLASKEGNQPLPFSSSRCSPPHSVINSATTSLRIAWDMGLKPISRSIHAKVHLWLQGPWVPSGIETVPACRVRRSE